MLSQAIPEVTVLVAELDGFPAYSTRSSAKSTVPFLNRVFGEKIRGGWTSVPGGGSPGGAGRQAWGRERETERR